MAGWDDIPNEEKEKSGWDDIPDIQKVKPKKSYSISEIPSTALSNIPGGLYEYGKALINPETYKAIGGVASNVTPAGMAINYIQRGKLPYEDVYELAKAYGTGMVEKYGGWENIKRTLAEKPVEALSDVASILMPAGKITGLKTITKAGQYIEPLSVAGKVVEKTIGGVKKIVSGPLGISTGAGKVPVEKAMEASETFKSALRGGISGEEVVGTAKGGVYAIRAQRGQTYQNQLSAIKNMPNPPQMDVMKPVKTFVDSMKDYNIALKQNAQGKITGLDFGRSSIRNNPMAQNDFNRVMDTLRGAMDDPSYFKTPGGFDILKRQFSDMYKESSQGRVVVERLQKDVRSQLVQRVSGYEKMVSDYEKTTKLINEIERDLTLGKKGSIDTAIRKLNTAMREDDDFRRSLIAEVEKSSGKNIQDMVSGRMMATWMPKTWMGREIAVGTIFGSIFGTPQALPALATASPRLVAETLILLSKGVKVGKKITTPVLAPERQFIYQTGRTKALERQEQ